ncbi:MAG: hypothetical protein ABSE66_03685 [Thermoplasmata archaeon]
MVDESSQLFGADGIRKVIGTEIAPVLIAEVIFAYAEWIDGAGPCSSPTPRWPSRFPRPVLQGSRPSSVITG